MTRPQLTDEQIEQKFLKAKPGRKPGAAAEPVALVTNHAAIAEDVQTADALNALREGYGQERDLLNQLLGQAQMADAFAKFSVTVTTSKLAFVKENKLYHALKGRESGNGYQLSGTWDEFCGLLNLSREKADLDIANLKAFGEEALESMSRMGIGYRELRQYRRLPEDQKLALIEVAKAGDKDGFLDLAEEMIARHAKEKESLATQVEEAKATLEAKDRVLADKNERLTKLEEEGKRKFKPSAGSEAKTAQEQALLTELDQASSAAYLAIHKTFAAADVALSDSGAREAIQTRARQAVEFLVQQLADMAEEFGIQVDLEARIAPPWLSEEALASLEARNAANPHTNPRAK